MEKRYIIVWRVAGKHELTYQFCSDVDENSKDNTLADVESKKS